MSTTPPPIRIGYFGMEEAPSRRGGCGLWPIGYAAAVTAAGGEPVRLTAPPEDCTWGEVLENIDGILFTGHGHGSEALATAEAHLCEWCRQKHVPILAVDEGLHVLNATFGGSLHLDLGRELPQALQHRHPPERGLRHAITVERGTRLADLYGEGEVVVNSEHRRGICRVARGFLVSARALDGVIEAVEAEVQDWFALGVQWHPASSSASGLDIQLFRGLVNASRESQPDGTRRAVCGAAA